MHSQQAIKHQKLTDDNEKCIKRLVEIESKVAETKTKFNNVSEQLKEFKLQNEVVTVSFDHFILLEFNIWI